MSKQGFTDPNYGGGPDSLKKEWYLGFSITCPVWLKRKPVQVRLGTNYHTTVKDRETEGKVVIALALVKRCLNEGGAPLTAKSKTVSKCSRLSSKGQRGRRTAQSQ